MSRPATARLKVNPPLGVLPALQYLLPAQLKVDPAYQRTLETGPSQTLVRRIAMHWNWDLCQPLVVARRENGELYVIDGQHRLEAAKLRGDIAQLPAVVVQYASEADEAASFVHLNQQRRPLTKLDVFKAAVASEDPEACAIQTAMHDAGLSVAPHSNSTAWKPGMVANLPGIERAWRVHGKAATSKAFLALSRAFPGQVLQFAGTIFPGIAAVCADEFQKHRSFEGARFDAFVAMLVSRRQRDWRNAIVAMKAEQPTLNYLAVSEAALRRAWGEPPAVVAQPRPVMASEPIVVRLAEPSDGKRWCEQCDKRVHATAAALCKDRHCKIRPRLTA